MLCDIAIDIDQVNWMFEAQNNELLPKEKAIKFHRFDMVPADYFSLGYCIARSQCQWVLSLREMISDEEVKMFIDGISTKQPSDGTVVGLGGDWDGAVGKGPSLSANSLNELCCKLNTKFHQLSLKLPTSCDHISWPDLSALKVLIIGG